MNAAQREYILTETWEDVEKLIYRTAHQFISKYGSPEFEDAVGVGHQVFMRLTDPEDRLYYRHDRGSKFSNYMRFIFWHVLLEAKEKEASHHARCPRDWSLDMAQQEAPSPRPGRLTELLDELTWDAYVVARLVLDTPKDLRVMLLDAKNCAEGVQDTIEEYLVYRGWPRLRIANAFRDVTRALSGAGETETSMVG